MSRTIAAHLAMGATEGAIMDGITTYDHSEPERGEYWASTSPNPCDSDARIFEPWLGDPAGPWIETKRGGGYVFGRLYDFDAFGCAMIER